MEYIEKIQKTLSDENKYGNSKIDLSIDSDKIMNALNILDKKKKNNNKIILKVLGIGNTKLLEQKLKQNQKLLDERGEYLNFLTNNQSLKNTSYHNPSSNNSSYNSVSYKIENKIPEAKIFDIPQAYHGKRKITDSLILHRTAGTGFHPNDTRLTKKGLGAQITIDKKGNIYQIGDLNTKMWHSGPKYNSRAIGIELTGRYLGNGKWEPLTEEQQKSLYTVSKELFSKYKIPKTNIFGHAEIAAKSPNEGFFARDLIIKRFF